MSDAREALARKLLDYISVQRLDWIDVRELYVNLEGGLDLLDAADAILAEFLVVPRSDIVGTEYGIRYISEDGKTSTWPSNATSQAAVIDLADEPGVTALERPVLPWSPIPLLEGDS